MDVQARLDASFKAYDIRGRVPEDLDEALVYRIGAAFAQYLKARRIVLGRDVRDTSEQLQNAFALGVQDAGCEVFDIGLCGTEEIYFATFHYDMDGGVMITASHNPLGWNGLKMVRKGSRPISGDTGLPEIKRLAAQAAPGRTDRTATMQRLDSRPEYVKHLLGYIDPGRLKPLTIAANAGNGGAGLVVDALEPHLPFRFEKLHFEPDGSFPNGVPNPLLPENRKATADLVRTSGADFGIAWDGDFDRCFFFDEQGRFLEGYYLVGLLGMQMLRKHPEAAIVHDPRLTWNTIGLVREAGGTAVQSRTGHAFMKETLREHDAVYGGEMSAHHYFRDFAYCDSGMIPWLLVAEIISEMDVPLGSLFDARIEAYPVSGEINRVVDDADAVLAAIHDRYAGSALVEDNIDGLSLEFDAWRFNLRKSNTEPLLRLNVETRADRNLLNRKTGELLDLIGGSEK